MSAIRSGNILIRAEDQAVKFEIVGLKHSVCASVGWDKVPEIMDFLQSYLCSQSNRRTGFRINLEQLRGILNGRFRVVIATDQGRISVTPIDLSLTGISIDAGHDFADNGAQVDIILSYDAKQVVLPAIAVNQYAHVNRTAFHFIGVVRDGELEPPPEMEDIFQQLEALWLDHCLQLGWFEQNQATNQIEPEFPELSRRN
tara:strand:+ start:3873 stop:4472 length:600 start_codon:yes stop_codon:yes gene_type:complete